MSFSQWYTVYYTHIVPSIWRISILCTFIFIAPVCSMLDVPVSMMSSESIGPTPWASCQIGKIVGCACAGNARDVFPANAVSRFRHASRHVTHVPWCMPGSLTSGFLWSWWRRKRSRHSRRMRNPQFYVSGKRPVVEHTPQVQERGGGGSLSHGEAFNSHHS